MVEGKTDKYLYIVYKGICVIEKSYEYLDLDNEEKVVKGKF